MSYIAESLKEKTGTASRLMLIIRKIVSLRVGISGSQESRPREFNIQDISTKRRGEGTNLLHECEQMAEWRQMIKKVW